MSTAPALQRSLAEVVAEYEDKSASLKDAIAAHAQAGDALKLATSVGGAYGGSIDTGRVHERELQSYLLKSAWRHAYEGLQIERIASANDKQRFKQTLEQPPPFTLPNIRATFGDFILDPRGNILRGLAEVFCSLDQAYKSHEKVKIGVKGLPKRVILSGLGEYSYGWGRDRLTNVLNALAAVQSKPLVTHREIEALLAREDALLSDGELPAGRYDKAMAIVGRGIRLRRFGNGNGHLFFEPDTLRDINVALAEYYGDVLADTTEGRPDKPRSSTAVSKDLQYYPTPKSVVQGIVSNLYGLKGQRVLEPSCGCGRFLDALRAAGAKPFGVEVDPGRAETCRTKGHDVLQANFLETAPTGDFDRVVMNPPFYGRHYAKHVEHAMRFLRPEGTLTAILPATARYDHGLLDGRWEDLPVGAFAESGTNINTTVLTMRSP